MYEDSVTRMFILDMFRGKKKKIVNNLDYMSRLLDRSLME